MKHWFQDRGFLWWAKLVSMLVVTGFNCALSLIRWGITSPDHLVQTDSLLLAAGSEVLLGIALWLFGERVYGAPRGWKILSWLVGQGWWGGVAALAMAISLYANVTYFIALHETLLDLAVRAGLPMALLIGFSVVPTKRRELTEAQIDERGQRELKKIQWQQRLQEAKDEPTRRALAEKAARKEHQEQEKAVLLDMLAIAQDAGMDTQRFYVNTGEGYEWNKRGLQRALEGLNLWPPVRETLGSVVEESVEEMLTEETDAMSDSGNHRSYISAEEVTEILGVSAAVAGKMMAARSAHPYAIKNCKNIRLRKPVRGRAYERRAPYTSVLEIKAKMEEDRASKVRPFPQPKPTAELQPELLEEVE